MCRVSEKLTWHAVGDEAEECIRRYNAFTSRIEELGLDNSVDAKPLLNVGHYVVPFLRLLTYVDRGTRSSPCLAVNLGPGRQSCSPKSSNGS